MALIVYPEANYDSFLGVEEADDIVVKYATNTRGWDNLSSEKKELYLRQSTLLIKNKINETTESETPFNLKLAVVYLSLFSIDKDMTNEDGSSNIKVLEVDGALKKEYFTKGKKSNSFPSIVSELLSEFGFRSAGAFRVERG